MMTSAHRAVRKKTMRVDAFSGFVSSLI
jgi:hypothetical protein